MNDGEEDFWRRGQIRERTSVPPVTVPRRMWPPPPEVLVSQGAAGWGDPPYGQQIFHRTNGGKHFPRYVECAGGCGWLIGVGDAVDTATHASCAARLAAATTSDAIRTIYMRGPIFRQGDFSTHYLADAGTIELRPWARALKRAAARLRKTRDTLIWRAGYEKRRDHDEYDR